MGIKVIVVVLLSFLLFSCKYDQTVVHLHPSENYMEFLHDKTIDDRARTFHSVSLSAYDDSNVKVESYYAQIDTMRTKKIDFQKVFGIKLVDMVQRNKRVYLSFDVYAYPAEFNDRTNYLNDKCANLITDSIIQLRTYEIRCSRY